MIKNLRQLAVLALLPFVACAGSDTPPEPAAVPRKFDRAFDAALGAAADVGMKVKTADRASGRILGDKDGNEVTIDLLRQADGSVRVGFSAPGSPETNPKLSDRWQSAYHRRMGR